MKTANMSTQNPRQNIGAVLNVTFIDDAPIGQIKGAGCPTIDLPSGQATVGIVPQTASLGKVFP